MVSQLCLIIMRSTGHILYTSEKNVNAPSGKTFASLSTGLLNIVILIYSNSLYIWPWMMI